MGEQAEPRVGISPTTPYPMNNSYFFVIGWPRNNSLSYIKDTRKRNLEEVVYVTEPHARTSLF